MDFSQITIKDIMAGIGCLLMIFDFGKWIISFQNPFLELKKRVDTHDKLFSKDKTHLDNIDNAVNRIDEGVTVLGKALNELLRHEITGNDIDELKKQQSRLNDYFYGDKKQDN